MPSVRRFIVLTLMIAALAAASLPAVGTEEPATDTTVTETTAAPQQSGAGNVVPAVSIPPESSDQSIDDWTYRFLIPTLLALAVIVVIATTIQYFMRVVRKRYKVVE